MPHYQLTVEFDSVPSPSCPHLHLSPTVSTDKSSDPREPRHGGDTVGLGTVNWLHGREVGSKGGSAHRGVQASATTQCLPWAQNTAQDRHKYTCTCSTHVRTCVYTCIYHSCTSHWDYPRNTEVTHTTYIHLYLWWGSRHMSSMYVQQLGILARAHVHLYTRIVDVLKRANVQALEKRSTKCTCTYVRTYVQMHVQSTQEHTVFL